MLVGLFFDYYDLEDLVYKVIRFLMLILIGVLDFGNCFKMMMWCCVGSGGCEICEDVIICVLIMVVFIFMV